MRPYGEKVVRLGIKRDDANYIYFVKRGTVQRVSRKPMGAPKGGSETIWSGKLETDPGYIYFLDADGDISRTKRREADQEPDLLLDLRQSRIWHHGQRLLDAIRKVARDAGFDQMERFLLSGSRRLTIRVAENLSIVLDKDCSCPVCGAQDGGPCDAGLHG